MSRGKLGIGLPQWNGTVDLDFLDYWTVLEKPDFTYYRPPFAKAIDKARNFIVRSALDDECDYLFMLDTDQTFPLNMIDKLWNCFWVVKNNPGAISGKVFRRYPPFEPIMKFVDKKRFEETGDIKYFGATKEQQHEEGLIEVDATGTGCIIFKCEVFKNIPYPWFEDKGDEGGAGEDIGFCQKLKAADYSIWVQRDIEVPQLAKVSVNQAFHDVYQLIKRSKEK